MMLASKWDRGGGCEERAEGIRRTISALLFAFLIYVIMVSVMSTVLSFPSETLVIVKEIKNNWYSCASYYWSKMIAEIPILCFMILILSVIIYPLTGQIPILWRFLSTW